MMFYTAVSAVSGIASLSLPASGKIFFLLALGTGFVFLASGSGIVRGKNETD
jgi:hypothetical protein